MFVKHITIFHTLLNCRGEFFANNTFFRHVSPSIWNIVVYKVWFNENDVCVTLSYNLHSRKNYIVVSGSRMFARFSGVFTL